MTRLRAIFLLLFCVLALVDALGAEPSDEWQVEALSDQGGVEYDFDTGLARGTNGVLVKYGGAVLTARDVSVNEALGEVIADGEVRIQRDNMLWVGEHVLYNFKTRRMEAEQFRTGRSPLFAAGRGLHAALTTNRVYVATNGVVTTDDFYEPAVTIRARYLRIIPGDRVIARDATLYLGKVPLFYFPYYSRRINANANHFNFVPGYRGSYGPFLLTSYTWFLNEELDGVLRADYRQRRGLGVGPDFNFHLGRWGEGSIKYYYLDDQDPNASLTNAIPHDRHVVNFSYLANPYTNLSVRSQVRYQNDFASVREFFEGDYRQNPQPSTFVEIDKLWQNFSLDVYAQPRVNDFLETVERLPDVRLTGFRQKVGPLPVYYESESSVGYYRRLFPETNGIASAPWFAAARADTYHQLLLPETLFGWLNVTPRVGGRYTYYGQASGPGAITDEASRGVFNTGAEVSFKASRLWPGVRNRLFELDGLRHIIEPSANYAYVPTPNVRGTNDLPPFDYELPSLRLLPNDFPDYNAIDSIDSQNVLRFGVRNKLQTKRHGEVVNLLNWDVYTDWRLKPRPDQNTFADVFSDLAIKPFSWLTLESVTRYDIDSGQWRMAFHTLTFNPGNAWSWTIGQFYLRDDLSGSPTALGEGNSLITSSMLFRLNENWGFRASHRFDLRDGRLQEQAYSVYRDLRLWTAALTFRIRETVNEAESSDFGVAFTFSLKAFPSHAVGADAARPYYMLGN